MKRSIVLWQIIGFFAVSVLGTLLHFLYDLSGLTFTALFSAVNESTWEHMKLLFFPMFFFAAVECFCIALPYGSFWCIKLSGTLLGLLLIPVLFYSLNGIFGTTPDWVNITIFFIAVLVSFIYETKQFKKETAECKYNAPAFYALCLIAVSFFIFTFMPPQIPLFQDPIDGGFGLHLAIRF